MSKTHTALIISAAVWPQAGKSRLQRAQHHKLASHIPKPEQPPNPLLFPSDLGLNNLCVHTFEQEGAHTCVHRQTSTFLSETDSLSLTGNSRRLGWPAGGPQESASLAPQHWDYRSTAAWSCCSVHVFYNNILHVLRQLPVLSLIEIGLLTCDWR